MEFISIKGNNLKIRDLLIKETLREVPFHESIDLIDFEPGNKERWKWLNV